MKMKNIKNKKRAVELEIVFWYLVGAAILVLGVVIVIILLGKGGGFVEAIKNFLRFRS